MTGDLFVCGGSGRLTPEARRELEDFGEYLQSGGKKAHGSFEAFRVAQERATAHSDVVLNDVPLGDSRWVTNFAQPVEEWLTANKKTGADVMWGRFPLGMVLTWMERARRAEAALAATNTHGGSQEAQR